VGGPRSLRPLALPLVAASMGAGKAGASSSWSGTAIDGAWKGTTTPEVERRREAVRCSSTQKIFC
jgi:hypothetical protein